MVAETISFTQTRPRTLQEALGFDGELTAEEFYELRGDGHHELIDGKVIETMPPGFDHGRIALRIGGRIDRFVTENSLGQASTEGGFRLQRRPDMVRSPDVCFVSNVRLENQRTSGFLEGAPDLAVEVNSPNDKEAEVEAKVQLYFEAGTRAVWIVEPSARTITVRTPDSAPIVYQIGDTLSGEPVLAGFELPLSEVFDF